MTCEPFPQINSSSTTTSFQSIMSQDKYGTEPIADFVFKGTAESSAVPYNEVHDAYTAFTTPRQMNHTSYIPPYLGMQTSLLATPRESLAQPTEKKHSSTQLPTFPGCFRVLRPQLAQTTRIEEPQSETPSNSRITPQMHYPAPRKEKMAVGGRLVFAGKPLRMKGFRNAYKDAFQAEHENSSSPSMLTPRSEPFGYHSPGNWRPSLPSVPPSAYQSTMPTQSLHRDLVPFAPSMVNTPRGLFPSEPPSVAPSMMNTPRGFDLSAPPLVLPSMMNTPRGFVPYVPQYVPPSMPSTPRGFVHSEPPSVPRSESYQI